MFFFYFGKRTGTHEAHPSPFTELGSSAGGAVQAEFARVGRGPAGEGSVAGVWVYTLGAPNP